MKNRISPPSRWPRDPMKRWQRANTDMDFVAAILNCQHSMTLDDAAELDRIYQRAQMREMQARFELQGRTD